MADLVLYASVAAVATLVIQLRARRTRPSTKEEMDAAVRSEAERSAGWALIFLGVVFGAIGVGALVNGAVLGAIVALLCAGLAFFGGLYRPS